MDMSFSAIAETGELALYIDLAVDKYIQPVSNAPFLVLGLRLSWHLAPIMAPCVSPEPGLEHDCMLRAHLYLVLPMHESWLRLTLYSACVHALASACDVMQLSLEFIVTGVCLP